MSGASVRPQSAGSACSWLREAARAMKFSRGEESIDGSVASRRFGSELIALLCRKTRTDGELTSAYFLGGAVLAGGAGGASEFQVSRT